MCWTSDLTLRVVLFDAGTVEDEPLQEAENLAKVPDTEQGSDAKPAEEMKKHASEQIACIEQLRDELSCAVSMIMMPDYTMLGELLGLK